MAVAERNPGKYIKEKIKDAFGIRAYQENTDPDYQKGKPDYRPAWLAFQFISPIVYRETKGGHLKKLRNRVGLEGQDPRVIMFAAMDVITTTGILVGIALQADQVDKVGNLAGLKVSYNLAMNMLYDFMEMEPTPRAQ